MEMAFFEQCTGTSLVFFSDKKTIPSAYEFPSYSVLDWNFVRRLSDRQAWNEILTTTLLATADPTRSRSHVGPSKRLAKLQLEKVSNLEQLSVTAVVFNPAYPVVAVIYENNYCYPHFSIHNFRAHSFKLGTEVFVKSFDHSGYISVSWSPNGRYLLAHSSSWENVILLFRYDPKSISMYELTNWQLNTNSGLHSSNLWIGSKSFLAYSEDFKGNNALRTYRLSGKRLKLTALQTGKIRDGQQKRGYLKVLSPRFYCETSLCENHKSASEESAVVACHSILHLMSRDLQDLLRVIIPGVLLDVGGQDEKCYILWRTSAKADWRVKKLTISSSSESCPLGDFSAASRKSDLRIELSVVDLKTLTLDPRSTLIDRCSSIWSCERSELMRYNETLSRFQPKISFTEHLLVVNPETWGRTNCTFVMHLRHRLVREPLLIVERAFFHPTKNAHAVVAKAPDKFPVSIFANRLCLPDFEEALKSKPATLKWQYSSESLDY